MRYRPWMVLAPAALAAGCVSVGPLTDADRAALASPPPAIATRVDSLQPGAVAFVEDSDRAIAQQGRALTMDETVLARSVGVAHPEDVRVLVAAAFIAPRDSAFAVEARKLGIGDASEGARTTGHGIQIKPRYAASRWILAHELTHVGQCERLGTAGFVHEYLTELLLLGYARAPLESAAHANERR
jgi:hypothetical protein